MSKFKVKLKIQAFELEIEGSREDIPLISQNIGNEIAGLITPAANIVEGKEIKNETIAPSLAPLTHTSNRRSLKKTRNIKSNEQAASTDVAINWEHKPEKWGVPPQNWTTAKKAIWLLYVVKEETGITELTANAIAATFNKHFYQSKTIQAGNTGRDLGKQKLKPQTPISENTTKDPSMWYLTLEGIKHAQKLVQEARGVKAEEG